MKKYTKFSIPWFYELLERGECDIMDFKESLDDREVFGKSLKNYAGSYDELARDAVAFANNKGGFLFIGIEDKNKEINNDFKYDDGKIFDLIRQVQDRTRPSISIVPHKLAVKGKDLLVLEIPFTMDLYSTTKGEYLIRSNNGNRAIQPHEMATILGEKGALVYDQHTWDIPNWQDSERVAELQKRIRIARADSPYLKDNIDDFNDALSFIKETYEGDKPTTTGVLFTGTDKALRNLPYAVVKYVRYFDNGTYRAYEWKGNLIEVADAAFAQLKAEIESREMEFGLFHDTIDDYTETVLREILINALAHRDYSRQQMIEIRKYPTYLEFESPGLFPQGIDEENFLWKTNPRNPEIMDVFRAIKYAEKAGSGWDKVFTELLTKGKALPIPQETDTSVIFRVEAAVVSDKLVELSHKYKLLMSEDPLVEQLLIMQYLIVNGSSTRAKIEEGKFINARQLSSALKALIDLEFIETTGIGTGTKYIIHKKHQTSIDDKVKYSQAKKQEKARQREAILRYLDEFDTISNAEVRKLLRLSDNDISYVSRLLTSMVKDGLIERTTALKRSQTRYKRVQFN